MASAIQLSSVPDARSILMEGGLPLPNQEQLVSDIVMGTSFMDSNGPSLFRNSVDLLLATPDTVFPFLSDVFSAKEVLMGYHAFGSATGINALIGLVQMKRDFAKLAYAEKIGDVEGVKIAQASIVKGGTMVGAGVSFAAYRPLAMVATIKNVSASSFRAPTLLGRVTYGCLFAGLAFYAIFFAIYTWLFDCQIKDGVSFRKALASKESLEDKVAFLRSQMQDDFSEVSREGLVEEAMQALDLNLEKLLSDLGLENVSPEKRAEVIQKFAYSEDDLKGFGLQLRVQKQTLAKQAHLSRFLNKEGIESIRKLCVQTDLKESALEELVKKVDQAAREQLRVNAAVYLVMALGVPAMILPLILTVGTGLVVSSVVMFVFGIVMTMVDGYYLLESYKEGTPGPYDKQLLLFSSAVAAASFAVLLALHFAGIASMGTVPLIVGVVLLGFWLAQNGISWEILEHNKRKMAEEHPTLVSYLELLEEGHERIEEVFARLPEKVQSFIKENQGQDLLKLAAKKEEEQKEALRQLMMPYLVG